ncbi:hypothetical protein HDV05_003985 [Chytridiales sp. JEL 0842]|nr:hypothetical protein HDV05_003985 [Chytridiales sp. JEL 0842]
MKTPLQRQHESSRRSIVLCTWALILLATPLWWETTKVERSHIPFDLIRDWAGEFNDYPLTYTSHIHILLPHSTATSTPNNLISPPLIASNIESSLSYLFDSAPLKNENLSGVESGGLRARVKLGFRVSGSKYKAFSSSSSYLDSEEEEDGKEGEYVVRVRCEDTDEDEQKKKTVVVVVRSVRRVEILLPTEECIAETIERTSVAVLGGIFAAEQIELYGTSASREKAEHEKMRKFKSSDEYQIIFNLLNGDTENMLVEWNIQEALKENLEPFFETMSVMGKFVVSSQIQQYAFLPVQPLMLYDSHYNQTFYALPPSSLTHFLNSAEWNLRGSAVSNAPPVNLIFYVSPKDVRPLKVVDSTNKVVETNAFLIPRWGGVVISNPPPYQLLSSENDHHDAADEKAKGRYKMKFEAADLRIPMEIFLEQLRGLLGVKPLELSAGLVEYAEEIVVENSRTGITDFEMDRLLRKSTVQNMLDAVSTLVSLGNLLENMENMVVLPHIRSQVLSSLAHLELSKKLIGEGKLKEAYRASREAVKGAEDAFFDKTMVGLLYFPDEHRYAVYMPFFTPVAVPVVVALCVDMDSNQQETDTGLEDFHQDSQRQDERQEAESVEQESLEDNVLVVIDPDEEAALFEGYDQPQEQQQQMEQIEGEGEEMEREDQLRTFADEEGDEYETYEEDYGDDEEEADDEQQEMQNLVNPQSSRMATSKEDEDEVIVISDGDDDGHVNPRTAAAAGGDSYDEEEYGEEEFDEEDDELLDEDDEAAHAQQLEQRRLLQQLRMHMQRGGDDDAEEELQEHLDSEQLQIQHHEEDDEGEYEEYDEEEPLQLKPKVDEGDVEDPTQISLVSNPKDSIAEKSADDDESLIDELEGWSDADFTVKKEPLAVLEEDKDNETETEAVAEKPQPESLARPLSQPSPSFESTKQRSPSPVRPTTPLIQEKRSPEHKEVATSEVTKLRSPSPTRSPEPKKLAASPSHVLEATKSRSPSPTRSPTRAAQQVEHSPERKEVAPSPSAILSASSPAPTLDRKEGSPSPGRSPMQMVHEVPSPHRVQTFVATSPALQTGKARSPSPTRLPARATQSQETEEGGVSFMDMDVDAPSATLEGLKEDVVMCDLEGTESVQRLSRTPSPLREAGSSRASLPPTPSIASATASMVAVAGGNGRSPTKSVSPVRTASSFLKRSPSPERLLTSVEATASTRPVTSMSKSPSPHRSVSTAARPTSPIPVIRTETADPQTPSTSELSVPTFFGDLFKSHTPFFTPRSSRPAPPAAASTPNTPFTSQTNDVDPLKRVLKHAALEELQDSLLDMLQKTPGLSRLFSRLDFILTPPLSREDSEMSLRKRIAVLEGEKFGMEAEWEARGHLVEGEMRRVRGEMEKLKEELETERAKAEKLAQALESERSSSSNSQKVSDHVTKEISMLKSTISLLDADKRNLSTVIHSKNEELDGYLRDLSRTRQDLEGARAEIRSLNERMERVGTEEARVRFERVAKEQECEVLKRNVEWLKEELNRRTEEFKVYRKEKTDATSTLQAQLEIITQERNAFELQSHSFKSKSESLEKRLFETSDKIRNLEEKLVTSEQSFKNEMSAIKKLSDSYESQASELSNQNEELQSLVKELEEGLEGLYQEKVELMEQGKLQMGALEGEIEERDKKIEKLKERLEMIDVEALRQSQRAQEDVGLLSTAAQAATKLQQSGKSFTEIYAEYTRLQDENVLANREISRLQDCLNNILNELSERAPMIQQMKVDKENSDREIAHMAEALSEANRAKDDAVAMHKELSDQVESLTSQNRIFQQESYDLSRQVQHLLLEIENLRAGPGGLSRSPGKINLGTDPSATSFSGRVISDRLVIFNNIVDLQTQNQKLRASLRNVSEALEVTKKDLEAKVEVKMVEELNEAAKMMEELQEQLRVANLKCSTYVKERDQWKRVAEGRGFSGGSPGGRSSVGHSRPQTPVGGLLGDEASGMDFSLQQLYNDLQREFDSFRKETGAKSKSLMEENEALQREKSTVDLQMGRLKNALELQKERYDALANDLKSQKEESEHLRERVASLVKRLSVQESKNEEVANQLAESKLSLDAALLESRHLRGEKELLKANEARAMAEIEGLGRQKEMANEHLKRLQKMFDDLDRQSKEALSKSEEKEGRVTKELEVVRQQLSNALDETRVLTARRETEVRDAHAKLERLSSQLSSTIRDRDVATAECKVLNDRVQDLLSRLSSTEDRLTVFEARANNAEESVHPSIAKIQELETEVEALKDDLNHARASLDLEKERVEQYKAIASSCEEKLLEFTTSYDQYKDEMDRKLQEAEESAAAFAAQQSKLETILGERNEELQSLQRILETERTTSKTELDSLKTDMARIQLAEKALHSELDSLKSDNVSLNQRLGESRLDYERVVLAEAERIRTLSATEDKVKQLKEKANQLQTRAVVAEHTLASSEKSWEEMRDKLQSEIDSLLKSNADLNEQNKILHDQFESLSNRISSLHVSLPSSTEAEAGTAETEEKEKLNNLTEVIRYLRREKDILQQEREMASQQTLRLEQQVELLQRSLDETRALLDNERLQGQVSTDSTKLHNELMEKIDSLNILRESNSTLRSQNEMCNKRIKLLEQRLKDRETESGPLKEQNMMLKAELEAVRNEMKALEEDNNRWKARTQQILAKYERIDPVEFQKLKDDLGAATAAKMTLEAELNLSRAKMSETSSSLNGKIAALSSQVDKLTSNLLASQAEINKLKSESESAAKSSAATMKQEIEKLTSQLQDAQEKNKAFVTKSNEIAGKQNAKIKDLFARIHDLSTQKEQLEVEKRQLAADDTDKIRLQLLEAQVKQLKLQIAEYESKIETLETASAASTTKVAPVLPGSIPIVRPPATPAVSSIMSAVITPSPTTKRQREEEAAEVPSSHIPSSSDLKDATMIEASESDPQHMSKKLKMAPSAPAQPEQTLTAAQSINQGSPAISTEETAIVADMSTKEGVDTVQEDSTLAGGDITEQEDLAGVEAVNTETDVVEVELGKPNTDAGVSVEQVEGTASTDQQSTKEESGAIPKPIGLANLAAATGAGNNTPSPTKSAPVRIQRQNIVPSLVEGQAPSVGTPPITAAPPKTVVTSAPGTPPSVSSPAPAVVGAAERKNNLNELLKRKMAAASQGVLADQSAGASPTPSAASAAATPSSVPDQVKAAAALSAGSNVTPQVRRQKIIRTPSAGATPGNIAVSTAQKGVNIVAGTPTAISPIQFTPPPTTQGEQSPVVGSGLGTPITAAAQGGAPQIAGRALSNAAAAAAQASNAASQAAAQMSREERMQKQRQILHQQHMQQQQHLQQQQQPLNLQQQMHQLQQLQQMQQMQQMGMQPQTPGSMGRGRGGGAVSMLGRGGSTPTAGGRGGTMRGAMTPQGRGGMRGGGVAGRNVRTPGAGAGGAGVGGAGRGRGTPSGGAGAQQ